MKKMKTQCLVGVLVLIASLAHAASTNDAVSLPKDTVDLNTSFKTANTNWIGKTLAEVLKGKEIERLIVVDSQYSQAPVKHLVGVVRNLWESKARLIPPPAEAELSVPISFLIQLKGGGFMKIQFEGNYGSLTTPEGVAYWKDKQE
jgi:hypothetical protein